MYLNEMNTEYIGADYIEICSETNPGSKIFYLLHYRKSRNTNVRVMNAAKLWHKLMTCALGYPGLKKYRYEVFSILQLKRFLL